MKYLLIILIMTALVISGCTMQMGKGEPPKIKDIHVGRRGIVLNFMDGLPADKIWDKKGLHIGVDIKNKGTADIEGGVLSIGGFDQQLVSGLIPLSGGFDFNLKGKSQYMQEGDRTMLEFQADTIQIPEGSQFLNLPVQVVACYPYETIASIPVCIDTSSYGVAKGKGECQVSDWSSNKGQGAPVGVTYIEQDMLPAEDGQIRVQFTIHLANLGNGDVIDSDMFTAPCDPYHELDNTNLDWVSYVVGISGNIITAQCEPVFQGMNKVKLYDGKNFIMCTATFDKSLGTHETLLSIALYYGYSNSITKMVKAVKMN